MRERPLRPAGGFLVGRPAHATVLLFVVLPITGCDGCDLSTRPDDAGVPMDGSIEDAHLPDAFFEDVPVAPVERRPFVFQQDEAAPPGRYVSMCGRFITDTPTVHLYRVTGSEPLINEGVASTIALPIPFVTASPQCVQFQIPSTVTMGLYAMWIGNGSDYSTTYYLNRARPYYVEYDTASPGTRVRIFGLNLKVPGATPTVKLVSAEATLDAVVDPNSNDNVLVFTMPSDVVEGTDYTVRVSNGHGGRYGEVDAEVPLRARSAGSGNIYGFDVPWAGDFEYRVRSTVSSGGNVQAAIDAAEAVGGGVVRLQAGTYGDFNLKTGVLVKGPDPETGVATINGRIGWAGASRAGIIDLTVSSNASWGATEAGQEKLVIRRVNSTHNHTGHVIEFLGVRHLLISDWTQSVTNMAFRPIDIRPRDGMRPEYIHIRRYNVTFIHSRLHIQNARYVTIDDSTSTRDFTRGYAPDGMPGSGHWNFEFTHNAALIAVRPRSVGNVAIRNDGEAFMGGGGALHASYPPYFGNADPSSPTTIEDEDQSFAIVNEDNIDYWVFLVDGTGVGQARKVASAEAGGLVVDPPWEVVPDATTRYVAMPLDIHRLLMRGCVMQQNSRGIWLYAGAYDIAIVGNTLQNSEIWLRSFERLEGGSGEATAEVYPLWKSYVFMNSLSTTTDTPIADGENPYNRSSHLMLTFNAHASSAGSYGGVYTLLHSFVNNRVDTWPVNRSFDPPLTEGIIANVNDEAESSATRGKAGQDPDTDPIVGVVFHGNTVDDANVAYQTGTGVRHMVITERRGNAINYEDVTNATVGHGANHFVVP